MKHRKQKTKQKHFGKYERANAREAYIITQTWLNIHGCHLSLGEKFIFHIISIMSFPSIFRHVNNVYILRCLHFNFVILKIQCVILTRVLSVFTICSLFLLLPSSSITNATKTNFNPRIYRPLWITDSISCRWFCWIFCCKQHGNAQYIGPISIHLLLSQYIFIWYLWIYGFSNPRSNIHLVFFNLCICIHEIQTLSNKLFR